MDAVWSKVGTSMRPHPVHLPEMQMIIFTLIESLKNGTDGKIFLDITFFSFKMIKGSYILIIPQCYSAHTLNNEILKYLEQRMHNTSPAFERKEFKQSPFVTSQHKFRQNTAKNYTKIIKKMNMHPHYKVNVFPSRNQISLVLKSV